MGGMRFKLAGMVDGEQRVVLEHITRMGEVSAPDWPRHPSPHGGYRVIVDGLPTYTVDIEMHGRGNNMRGLTYATVMRELNAIPAVMAAPPGLLSTLDLPLVTGPVRGGTWRGVLPTDGRRTAQRDDRRVGGLVDGHEHCLGRARYREEPVDDDVLERCLQAATWAPSGGNQQPWRFVVLRSPRSARGDPRGSAARRGHDGGVLRLTAATG